MPQLINLTGQKIGHLTVLEKAKPRKRHVYWKCQCDCGNIIEVSGESLRKQTIADCGCIKQQQQQIKEQEKNNKLNYLIGKRFGKLTVKERTNERINNSVVWKCQCDCGNYKNVPTHLLTSGHTKSCGCLIREVRWYDITNQRFGKLVALYPNEDLTLQRKRDITWHCKCDCGNECDVASYQLRKGITRSCGCLISTSIGEETIKQILLDNNISFRKEYSPKGLNRLRFDFAIFDDNNQIKRLIEYDGEQHYHAHCWNSDKDSLEQRQTRDKIKNQWALNHNIPLVRIPYWERDNITLDMLLIDDKYLVKE